MPTLEWFRTFLLASLAVGMTAQGTETRANSRQEPSGRVQWANACDRQRAAVLARRAADWRNGAIVYQVIVDRFAPPENLETKQPLYPPPKRLRKWNETPKRGEFLPDELAGSETRIGSGTILVTMPAQTIRVFRPVIAATHEYSPYKRVQ